jgi:hypothetical protein
MTRLMERLRHMLGTWRGPITLDSGWQGIFETSFTPYFEGAMIEVNGRSFDPATGESYTWGLGQVALDEAGRVVWRSFHSRIGFSTMREVDDDPDVLTLKGPLAGNREMIVCWQLDGDELQLTVSALEQAAGATEPHTVTRLRRVSLPMPEPQP